MTTQTEALKLALEALYFLPALSPEQDELQDAAIEAIKEALAQPEQEPVEDLQAKLKWATEQLEANINWEFVAAAKEEMLKAAWAEIKELREQIKEPEQEPFGYWYVDDESVAYRGSGFIKGSERPKFAVSITPLYTTPPQRKPLTESHKQEPVAWWVPKAEQFCLPSSDGTRPFAKAWEPLYTTPPQRTWVGLTDEDWTYLRTNCGSIRSAVETAESKLKEKNA